VGHIVSPEASLELIPGDSFDIGVSVAVSLPPVSCNPKQLVCREQSIFTVRALGYLQFLLDRLQLVLCIYGILGLRNCWGGSSEIHPA
jgi:hypothetical protein